MKEVVDIADKQVFLNSWYPIEGDVPKISDRMLCLHCEKLFTAGDYKAYEVTDEFSGHIVLCCPNAPECDGTSIDWVKDSEVPDPLLKPRLRKV